MIQALKMWFNLHVPRFVTEYAAVMDDPDALSGFMVVCPAAGFNPRPETMEITRVAQVRSLAFMGRRYFPLIHGKAMEWGEYWELERREAERENAKRKP